jgi:hypothetical protein
LTFLIYEDVRRFEISVDDPVVVEVGDSVEELPEKRFENSER